MNSFLPREYYFFTDSPTYGAFSNTSRHVEHPAEAVVGLPLVQIDYLRRRGLKTIDDLPNELLCKTFEDIHVDNVKDDSGRPRPYHLLNLMHVCRKWREVVLEDASLWSVIEKLPVNKDFTKLILERARKHALFVTAEIQPSTVESWNLVLGRAPQIASLELFSSGADLVKAINAVLDEGGGRRVRYLSMQSTFCYKHTVFDDQLARLGTQMTEVTTLRLIALNLSWQKLPSLPSLRHLELVSVHGLLTTVDGEERRLSSSVGELVDFLRGLPCLETLILEDMNSQTTQWPSEALSLCNLKSLHIDDIVPQLINMISCLHLPALRYLTLHTSANDEDNPDDLISCIANATEVSLMVRVLHVLAINKLTELQLRITSYGKQGDGAASQDAEQNSVGLSVEMKIDTGNPDEPDPNDQDSADRDPWLVAICSMPTYRNVNEIVLQAQQTIDADSNAYIAWETWCDALAHFNELQILRVRNFVQFSDLSNILYALSLHPGEDMRTDHPYILPRLRVLDLDNFDFSEARDRSCLLDCLKQRHDEIGAPVQELVLSRCEGISQEFLVELMGYVDTICEDGQTKSLPDWDDFICYEP